MNGTNLSRRGSNLLRSAVILGFTLLVYLPAMRGDFLWDDNRYVTENAIVRSERGFPYIWAPARTKDFYPVLYSSFWVEWRIWGNHPAGYHLTNILLHAANSILVWLVLARLRVPGAWLCGLLFAVHPLNVESVAWISQRKNTLAMFFFLLCFLTYPWRRDKPSIWRYPLALFLFTLSLLTKPIVIMFPFLIPLYRWWRNTNAQHPASRTGDQGRTAGLPGPVSKVPCSTFDVRYSMFHVGNVRGLSAGGRRVARNLAESMPFFAVSAICGVMTVAFQQAHSVKGVPVGPATLAGKTLAAAQAVLFYLWKTLLPLDLCAVYPEWETDRITLPAVLPLTVILLIGYLLFRKRASWGRPMLFAAACLVLMLFPVLGFFEVGFLFYAMVADHWMYPALPALLAVAVGPAVRLLAGHRGPHARSVGMALAASAIVLLSALSFRQSALYTDARSLFTDTIRKNPRAWVAHVILGNMAFSGRDLARAEAHYRIALREKPGYWEAQNGLGIVCAMRGELDEAIERFTSVLAARPEHASARNNLALARRQQAAMSNAEQGTRNSEQPAEGEQ